MGNIWVLMLGIAGGACAMWAYTRQMGRAIARERAELGREIDRERGSTRNAWSRYTDISAQLAYEQNRNAIQQAAEDGWAQGYADAINESLTKSDAEKFSYLLDKQQRATIAMRNRRGEHGKQGA